MHAADNASLNDMANGYYEKPQPKKTTPVGFRAPQALVDKLEALVELWRVRAEVDRDQQLATAKFKDADEKAKLTEKLDDEVAGVDFTYVCNRLMKLAADEALAETLKQIGFDHVPSSDDEWAEANAAFLKNAKSRK